MSNLEKTSLSLSPGIRSKHRFSKELNQFLTGWINTNHSWNGLDNAALIFPAASKRADTHVFRISCELHGRVDPVVLQNALDETLKIFAVYQSVLKRGFFWYYLEHSDLIPMVHEEITQPCRPIYNRNRKKLLFEVSYFKNRVNLEVYHVLSDGTGAMQFLRTLIAKYLSKVHHLDEPPISEDVSVIQMNDDSFRKYYSGARRVKHVKTEFSCRLHGLKYPEDRLKVITGHVDIAPLMEAAHRNDATLTVFVCACLMNAMNESLSVRVKRRPIVLAVPVNLRKHFPSASARNFFSVLLVGYDYWNRSSTFEDVLTTVRDNFRMGLSHENLCQRIDTYAAVENNIFVRMTPLFVKDLLLKVAYDYSVRRDTAGFSNLGVISMPPELEPLIRSFDIHFATNKLQVCMCSYQGLLSISFSTPFISSEIQRRFFRTLTDLGANVEITTNADDGKGES